MSQQSAFQRFNWHHRLQHIMMFVGFIICALTGVAIKYDYTGWAPVVVAMFGGFDNMLTVHLAGAVIIYLCCIYHLVYLAVYPLITGKVSWAALPSLKDVTDVYQNVKYFLGLSPDRPKIDRFSYKEKFDYWAVFWGILIVGGSGFMLWFPEIAAAYVPRWVIESARYAHSDEAMLAILAIFVWHFYNVHLSPSFFPMSDVWYTGRMSYEQMEEEHPLELERQIREGKVIPPVNAKGGKTI